MRIIIPNLAIPALHNVARCLESVKHNCGIEPLLWDCTNKSFIDMCDEVNPDIIFLHSSQLDAAFALASQEFNFKYILIADEPIPAQKSPAAVLTSSSSVKNWKDNTPVVVARDGSRIAEIHSSSYNSTMASDILIQTNEGEITKDMLHYISFLTSSYHTKVIGDTPVAFHQYLGKVNMFERATFIKSAKILIDFYGTECWDAAYLKVPAICRKKAADNFWEFNNIKELEVRIDALLHKDAKRSKYIEECYKAVYNGNTQYHVAANLFQRIDENNIAQTLHSFVKELQV